MLLAVEDYALGPTLESGQVFRWREGEGAWRGVLGRREVRLRAVPEGIEVQGDLSATEEQRVRDFLQLDIDLAAVVGGFPQDPIMGEAVRACRGLRLLRQDAWECLASFILSSTKQIVQIQQVVEILCDRFGERLPGGAVNAFPGPERLASCEEVELRACRMGFRAPYLLAAARAVSAGELDLVGLGKVGVEEARMQLMGLPGVGRKIANCVLLFAYGYQEAFPVDVWVQKALRELYFGGRRVPLKELEEFSGSYFRPYGGYAQQYLFHYMRKLK